MRGVRLLRRRRACFLFSCRLLALGDEVARFPWLPMPRLRGLRRGVYSVPCSGESGRACGRLIQYAGRDRAHPQFVRLTATGQIGRSGPMIVAVWTGDVNLCQGENYCLFLFCQRKYKFQSSTLIVLGGDAATVDDDGIFHDGQSQPCSAQFA